MNIWHKVGGGGVYSGIHSCMPVLNSTSITKGGKRYKIILFIFSIFSFSNIQIKGVINILYVVTIFWSSVHSTGSKYYPSFLFLEDKYLQKPTFVVGH